MLFLYPQKNTFYGQKKRGLSPTTEILPPLRGSRVNIVFSVGYVCFAHFTHGWGLFAAMRLWRLCIPGMLPTFMREHKSKPSGELHSK